MIGCDGKNCKFKWYHYDCVGLDAQSIPDGDWFCTECEGMYFQFVDVQWKDLRSILIQ